MASSGLIGHTGFVGSNLNQVQPFDLVYNSQNIHEIQGEAFDLLVCAAPQAKKWWANQHPEEDRKLIVDLIDRLKQATAKRFVLISTIDVFPIISDADESFDCSAHSNHAYGRNRLMLEQFVVSSFPTVHIVRLPGLVGKGLKKNVIFDLLNDNQLDLINPSSEFQWYNLSNLGADLKTVIENDIRLVVFATEPIKTAEIQVRFFPDKSIGASPYPPVKYDIHTRYASVFNNEKYIASKEQILEQIGRFVTAEKEKFQ